MNPDIKPSPGKENIEWKQPIINNEFNQYGNKPIYESGNALIFESAGTEAKITKADKTTSIPLEGIQTQIDLDETLIDNNHGNIIITIIGAIKNYYSTYPEKLDSTEFNRGKFYGSFNASFYKTYGVNLVPANLKDKAIRDCALSAFEFVRTEAFRLSQLSKPIDWENIYKEKEFMARCTAYIQINGGEHWRQHFVSMLTGHSSIGTTQSNNMRIDTRTHKNYLANIPQKLKLKPDEEKAIGITALFNSEKMFGKQTFFLLECVQQFARKGTFPKTRRMLDDDKGAIHRALARYFPDEPNLKYNIIDDFVMIYDKNLTAHEKAEVNDAVKKYFFPTPILDNEATEKLKQFLHEAVIPAAKAAGVRCVQVTRCLTDEEARRADQEEIIALGADGDIASVAGDSPYFINPFKALTVNPALLIKSQAHKASEEHEEKTTLTKNKSPKSFFASLLGFSKREPEISESKKGWGHDLKIDIPNTPLFKHEEIKPIFHLINIFNEHVKKYETQKENETYFTKVAALKTYSKHMKTFLTKHKAVREDTPMFYTFKNECIAEAVALYIEIRLSENLRFKPTFIGSRLARELKSTLQKEWKIELPSSINAATSVSELQDKIRELNSKQATDLVRTITQRIATIPSLAANEDEREKGAPPSFHS